VFLRGSNSDHLAKAYHAWILFSAMARLPIVLAGAAGLFICFWPGPRPVRRICVFVFLPSIAGTVALCVRFLSLLGEPFASVLQKSPLNEAGIIKVLWSIGPALHVSVLGVLLILVFLSRLSLGIATLPLSLNRDQEIDPDETRAWKRVQIFIWISIVGTSILGFIAGIAIRPAYWLALHLGNFSWLPADAPITTALATALLAGIAALAVGATWWKELQRFTRIPTAQFVLLGAFFPIVIRQIPNLLLFVYDRIHWASFEFGRLSPPLFSSYFQLPDIYLLWYLPAAAFEEIIWRGYLQPRFVGRFGIVRGIFLLGLVWSAFHFLGDFQKTTDDYDVALKLLLRLSLCVGMSYAFGWLTLRSGSIWPAALCHGLQNVLVLSNPLWFGQNPIMAGFILSICWGILGFMLFRFWPPAIDVRPADQLLEARSQPAI
jgi:membrane protease YdiL (CAAX protease family)